MIMLTRCRRCAECLRYRSREWSARARCEVGFWPVSFLGTLTLAPEEHVWIGAAVLVHFRQEGIDDPTESEVFLGRCHFAGQLVTTWLKRVRKDCMPLRLRYLLVAEAHKSGLPHFHVLLHVCDAPADAYDVYAAAKSQWPHGHSDFSGLGGDPSGASYVCKYLTKSALARVRASTRYGTLVATLAAERSEAPSF